MLRVIVGLGLCLTVIACEKPPPKTAPAAAPRAGAPGMRIDMATLHDAGGVPPGWHLTPPPGDPEAGRHAFVDLGCDSCHIIRDVGATSTTPDEHKGPELTTMGGHHPAEYFVESIYDPDAVLIEGPGYIGADGHSTMPAYPDLTVTQLADLVVYLQSLGDPGAQPARRPGFTGLPQRPAPPEKRAREAVLLRGLGVPRIRGPAVPALRTRIVIDAPESLPLKHVTRLLPNAQVKERAPVAACAGPSSRARSTRCDEMQANLPSDAPGWPSVEFSSGASWETVASVYRGMTEPRMRNRRRASAVEAHQGFARSGTPKNVNTSARSSSACIAKCVTPASSSAPARLIPEYPSETLRRRFGDCKDKSTLLVAALRASGIDAYLALLSAGDDEDVSPELPGFGMFDHAIVYVPGVRGGADLWIDATAEYARVGTLPAQDSNRLALIIRPGTSALTRTPVAALDRQPPGRDARILPRPSTARRACVETTETTASSKASTAPGTPARDTKERVDQLKTYMRDAYRAKQLLELRAHREHGLLQALLDAHRDEGRAGGLHGSRDRGRRHQRGEHHRAAAGYFDSRVDETRSRRRTTRTADVVFEPLRDRVALPHPAAARLPAARAARRTMS